MNGDVTISNTGATTIVPNAVTSAKIADSNVTNAKLQNSSITINGNTVDLGGTATINASPIGSALTSGNIIVGDTAGVAAEVTMNGDVTITNAGVTVIGTGKVNDVKLDKTNIPLSGFGAALAAVDLGSNKLTNVTDPTLAQDAATKNYVDSATAAITNLTNGNVFIGNSSNVATPVAVTGDVTITNAGVTTIGTGKVDNTKLDKTNIPLSGFGAASANVALGGNKLSGVADPTLAQDAATKSYVDAATGAITTLADGKIYIGSASNVAAEVSMNGDVSISNTGATTIVPNAITSTKIADSNVTNAKLQNSSITINGNTVALGGTATINASPVGTALTSGNVLVGSASNLAAEVTMNGDVTISNTGATTIVPNAVTSTKIQDGTITNADISNTAAIQTTKIKGFYTGNYKTNVSSTTNGVEIKLSDLSIPPLNSNSTIIIHSNTTNLSIKSSVPVDDDSDVTNFELINVSFQAIGSNTIISLSYIIIIN
jgi:hypothetical protein